MVSIILPNLNTDHNYLNQRIESIVQQTYMHWECIIIDGFSDNGSAELLESVVKKDSRFKMYRKERRGIYNALNEGIRLATGDLVYIATSDDTMGTSFLSKMVGVLDDNQDCDIAHCCLQIIDENGRPHMGTSWNDYLASAYFGDLMRRKHIRYSPHDGILHAFIKTVYHSLTQLLIRKTGFDKAGYFVEDAGGIADFEWGMRAGLFCHVAHLPEVLATWRIHPNQVTERLIHFDHRTYRILRKWVIADLNLAKRRYPERFAKFRAKELVAVYTRNELHYRLRKKAEGSWLFSWLYGRASSKFNSTNGLREAREYFGKNDLNKLIECI